MLGLDDFRRLDQEPALIFCIKRLFLRAAVFLCNTPFATARSILLIARRTAESSSEPMLAVADFTRVFNSLRTARLRSAAFALVRIRFFWLLIFATVTSNVVLVRAPFLNI